MSVLRTYSPDAVSSLGANEVGDALEQGYIVKFERCPIELPPAEDLSALREELPKALKSKNVSYHPEADRVTGLEEGSPVADLAHEVLSGSRSRIDTFLQQVMPSLAAGMRSGTCSFRPIEEQGRNLKPHASNELVHVDAGAYGATNGNRILRFFVNVNPNKDRVWATKGAFPGLFERFGREAGLYDDLTPTLERGLGGKLRTTMLKGLAGMGLPLATVLDSSPYDRIMRKFHNYMKDTPAFQENTETHEVIHFEPFSAWMVLTDMVSHASVSGQHALVYTALVPLESCRHPELAPINILRSAA